MENIVEPNESFDFSKLSLAHPVGIQGGAYFTKIEYNKKPLYIQTSKCLSRQGFVKTGKKYYIDLMFDKNAELLINWFENLETSCQKLIFERKDSWFQNGLEESDIESAFNSTIRIYKSGKFYLLRTNVKNNHQQLPAIKIYNEKETPLTMENVTPETNIISILEIQGIKFTTRNFQIEIECKQVMVLDNEPLFDNCLIKPAVSIKQGLSNIVENNTDYDNNLNNLNNKYKDTNDNDNDNDNALDIEFQQQSIEISMQPKEQRDEIEKEGISLDDFNDLPSLDIIGSAEQNETIDNVSLDIEDLDKNDEDNEEIIDELKEIDNLELSLGDNLDVSEPIQLKKPNQVYFELYKEARNKAKQAKKNAIIAYLEAKNIKKTYMLESLIDSDSDFDEEIDAVSESELEDF